MPRAAWRGANDGVRVRRWRQRLINQIETMRKNFESDATLT
jgi:hypothetical protein